MDSMTPEEIQAALEKQADELDRSTREATDLLARLAEESE